MCVDHSQTLWGVFDIYGTTTQIVVSKLSARPSLGGCAPNTIVQSTPQPSTSYDVVPAVSPAVCYASQPPMVRSNILEVNTDANGGTVLIVNLPAAQTNQICHPSPALTSQQASGIQQQVSARPPSVTIQQIQPRVAPAQQPHHPEVRYYTRNDDDFDTLCIMVPSLPAHHVLLFVMYDISTVCFGV